MDFYQLADYAAENDIDVPKELQDPSRVDDLREFLGFTTLFIPEDVIPLIQEYLPVHNFVRSTQLAKSFRQFDRVSLADITFYNSKKPIPEYITKVEIGDKVVTATVKDATQLVYLDARKNHNITDKAIEKLVNLEELKMASKMNGDGLEKLPKLKHLTLKLWNFTKFSSNLIKLKQLEYLDLGDVGRGIAPKFNDDFIKNFVNLRELKLGDSRLIEITENGLKNLTKLETLNCGKTKIVDVSFLPKLTKLTVGVARMKVSNLVNLKYLDLTTNEYQDYTNFDIENLANLESLNIGMSALISEEAVEKLSKLKVLGINNNTIPILPELKQLYLGYDSIMGDEIGEMRRLERLEMEVEEVTDEGIFDLFHLTHLKVNENITDNGIKRLKNLEYLNLVENDRITFGGIKDLPNLRYLNIGRNPHFSKEEILQLDLIAFESIKLGNFGYFPDFSIFPK